MIWNNLLGELWRRSTIYLPRKLAKLTGITQKRLRELVCVSYVKASEYQRRGLVHLHTVIRLDRRMPDYRADELRAPDQRFTSELLEQALRATVEAVSVKEDPRRARHGGHDRVGHSAGCPAALYRG